MKDFSYNAPMDSVRELVVARVAEIGETLKSVSKSLGRNDAYLQQFVHRGVPGKLPIRPSARLN